MGAEATSVPDEALAYGPCFEVSEEDGNIWYCWAPLPVGIDPELRLDAELDAQIIERLEQGSIADYVRATLVPARAIEIIADGLSS